MAATTPRSLRTWGDEFALLWRRWWWVLAVVWGMTLLPAVPAVQIAFNWALVVVPALFLTWLVITSRRMPHADADKWKRDAARNIVATWPDVAMRLGLSARSMGGGVVVAGIGQPQWEGWTCAAPVGLPQGLGREHLQAHAGLLAQAFGAREATVHGVSIGQLILRLEYGDALAQPFSLGYGEAWDGRTVVMGRANGGSPWRLRLGPHTLVAGSSGSGKASLVWGLLLGLAQPIHSGLVEIWGIDRKGGMELAMGQPLLTRFAAEAERSVVLLEEAVNAMQARARHLAGRTRQHVAAAGSPTVVILIDELAALTAYETDRDLMRRANSAIATLASQGRAVGFIVFACLQDPRKETLPARGLFTQTVGLRLRDGIETAMVLGDGAVAAGAFCHQISPDTPGVAYVLPEDGTAPIRVRAGLITDDMIRDAAHRFPAPRHVPVVIPESPTAPERPARAPRQPRRTSRKEAS
ncbi:FtsK/SpoIIIE domain-containing protein [Microbacterium sp.]|jgi:S-DNA-T family DNA segregation ATPase FtsK/SpoIIIE|uniref:FtsK/SpoIIIE domain-containing protein n=1 Tax=Microbacterium sp. TaxID=51671 RepID=UPI0037C83C8C